MSQNLKNYTWLSFALFIYVTVMAVYFLPRNNEMSMTEKCIYLGVSYLVVLILWLVLRKKEQSKARREAEAEHYNSLKQNEK